MANQNGSGTESRIPVTLTVGSFCDRIMTAYTTPVYKTGVMVRREKLTECLTRFKKQ